MHPAFTILFAVTVLIVLYALLRQLFLLRRKHSSGCPTNVPCTEAPMEAPQEVPEEEIIVVSPGVEELSPFAGWQTPQRMASFFEYQDEPVPNVVDAIECKTLQEVENGTKSKAVVLFYATGCSPCNAFKPTYYKAARKAAVPFYAIDAIAVPECVEQYKLLGFPTVMKFSNGRLVGEYNGNRTEEDLLQFAYHL